MTVAMLLAVISAAVADDSRESENIALREAIDARTLQVHELEKSNDELRNAIIEKDTAAQYRVKEIDALNRVITAQQGIIDLYTVQLDTSEDYSKMGWDLYRAELKYKRPGKIERYGWIAVSAGLAGMVIYQEFTN